MKKYLAFMLKYVGSLSVFAVLLSANTTSTWISHQSKVPEGVRKFKKIN